MQILFIFVMQIFETDTTSSATEVNENHKYILER